MVHILDKEIQNSMPFQNLFRPKQWVKNLIFNSLFLLFLLLRTYFRDNVPKYMHVLDSQFQKFIAISNKFRLGQSVENWILQKRIHIFPP